jgi:signal transduction protein with GAF and PtsI domain
VRDVGRGTKVFEAAAVRGAWRPLDSPDDVLALMDDGDAFNDGVIAVVADAGATFLAPVFDDLTAVVCLSGTPLSHIGIVSREYEVPCIMATTLTEQPGSGATVEVDCSGDEGIVRT